MFIKFLSLSVSSLIFLEPTLNVAIEEKNSLKNNHDYLSLEKNANESEKQVIDNDLMDITLFRKYKNEFLEIIANHFKNEKSNDLEVWKSHIFDRNFWINELKFWWAAASLHIWMSTIAIEQFSEAIGMGVTAAGFVAGLGTVIPGFGLAIGIYMVANMAVWRHINQGKGVVSRYLFGFIPTGYWAET